MKEDDDYQEVFRSATRYTGATYNDKQFHTYYELRLLIKVVIKGEIAVKKAYTCLESPRQHVIAV